MESNSNENISLNRIILMIWVRLPLVVLCTVAFFIIGLIGVFTGDDSVDVVAKVNVQSIPGVRNFSNEKIAYFISSEKLLTPYIDDEHDIEDIQKDFDVTYDYSLGYINLNVSDTSEPEFWIHIMDDVIERLNVFIMDEYTEEAQKYLGTLKSNIENVGKISESAENKETLNSLMIEENRLESALNEFDYAVKFTEMPEIKKIEKSSIKTLFITIILGGVSGVVLALIAGFTDKRLDFSSKVRAYSRRGKLVLCIPEFKRGAGFDQRYCEYLASLLNSEDQNIAIFSMHKSDMPSVLAAGLPIAFAKQGRKDDSIVNGRSINTVCLNSFDSAPDLFRIASSYDSTIVVLDCNNDTVDDLNFIERNLSNIELKNTLYVLNNAQGFDREILKFDGCGKFSNLKFRFW